MIEVDDVLTFLERGEVKKALKYAEKVQDKENMTNVLNNFAVSLIQQNEDFKNAELILRKSIDIFPQAHESYYNLGVLLTEPEMLLEDRTREKEAEKFYRESIKRNPDYVMAHYNLGLLLAFTKRKGEAEKEYKKVLELDPKHRDRYKKLEELLRK